MNTIGQIDESLSNEEDPWDSSVFHTQWGVHTQWGGRFVDTQTWEDSVISLGEYPNIKVHWVSIGYSIRQKIFEGQFIDAVDTVINTKWEWVHMIQILWKLYSIISQIPGNTSEISVRKSVDNAEPKILKALRFTQKPVTEILSSTQASKSTKITIVWNIEDMDLAKELIHTEVQRQTQILFNILEGTPGIDGALRLYKMIFVWCTELPVELFIEEIDWLKNFLKSHKWITLAAGASPSRQAAFDGMLENFLLLKR